MCVASDLSDSCSVVLTWELYNAGLLISGDAVCSESTLGSLMF